MTDSNPFQNQSILPARSLGGLGDPKAPFGVDIGSPGHRFGPKGPGEGGAPPQFGLAGGPASAAGPQGSSVTTNETVAARFTPAIVSNPFQLTGSVTDLAGYKSLDIDRPMILYSLSAAMEGPLLYHPDRIPARDLFCNRSQGHGIAYLSNPGRWWVKYAAAGTIELVLHDASDPSVASKYLSEPGTHTSQFPTLTIATNLTASTLVQANLRRKAVFIQNLTTTIPVRIAWDGQSPVTTTPPNGPGGVRLGGVSGTTITLSGDMLTKSEITVSLESATAAAQLVAVEWT